MILAQTVLQLKFSGPGQKPFLKKKFFENLVKMKDLGGHETINERAFFPGTDGTLWCFMFSTDIFL